MFIQYIYGLDYFVIFMIFFVLYKDLKTFEYKCIIIIYQTRFNRSVKLSNVSLIVYFFDYIHLFRNSFTVLN